MGLVKTRRLAATQKQTTYAKATMVRQRAKVGMKPPVKFAARKGNDSFLLWSGSKTTRRDSK